MAYYNEKIDIRGDGRIILFKRLSRGKISPTWFMRISLPLSQSKGYFQSTTRETDERLASTIALNKYDELYDRVKRGGKINSISFSKLFQEWSEHWLVTSKQKKDEHKQDKIDLLGNYPLKYFKEVQKDMAVDDITESVLSDYLIWRKQNSFSHVNKEKFLPKPSTMNSEIVVLNQVLEYGRTKGYLTDKPVIKRESLTDNRRPTFTKIEMRKITKQMSKRVDDSHNNVKRDRFYLQHYVLILSNTGLRVGEFRLLRWEDIRTKDIEGEKRLILSVSGKTGQRDVVSNKGTETYFKRLFDYRTSELNGSPPLNEFVICHADGKSIGSFKRSFDSLLSSIDLNNDTNGNKRTIYSLRHYFATMRLEEEVSPYLLAQNMGTSIEMLRKFYGQVVTERVALELTKTKTNITVKKSNKDYPFD